MVYQKVNSFNVQCSKLPSNQWVATIRWMDSEGFSGRVTSSRGIKQYVVAEVIREMERLTDPNTPVPDSISVQEAAIERGKELRHKGNRKYRDAPITTSL